MNTLEKYNPFLRPLHLCNSGDFTKTHYVQQTEFLRDHLRELIDITTARVPGRDHDFLIERKDIPLPKERKNLSERHLEYAIYDLFKECNNSNKTESFPGISHIPFYQFPLRASRSSLKTNKKPINLNVGWGKVDLLGCNKHGTPAVIELKIPKKNPETPLRIIVEGMAYAIAIRAMWNHPNKKFQEAWVEKIGSKPDCLCENIEEIGIIGLAPERYWEKWRSTAPKFSDGEKTWGSATKDLLLAAKSSGFSVDFVSFDEGDATTPPSNFRVITQEFCNQTS